jgi:hypothetical protein
MVYLHSGPAPPQRQWREIGSSNVVVVGDTQLSLRGDSRKKLGEFLLTPLAPKMTTYHVNLNNSYNLFFTYLSISLLFRKTKNREMMMKRQPCEVHTGSSTRRLKEEKKM